MFPGSRKARLPVYAARTVTNIQVLIMKAANTLLVLLATAGVLVSTSLRADDLGSAIGGGVGAVAGALIGDSMAGRSGAIVGSGVGGAVGAVVGNRISQPATYDYRGSHGHRPPAYRVEHHHYYPAHPGRGHAHGHYKARHKHDYRHYDRYYRYSHR